VWKRVAATLVLAVTLVGCENGYQTVPLVTGVPNSMKGTNGRVACFTNSASGPLVTDPRYGTAIIDMDTVKVMGLASPLPPVPVAWRPGFTGRRVGSEVEVLDPHGNVVAMTGRNYAIAGAGVDVKDMPGLPTNSAFWACDFVLPSE